MKNKHRIKQCLSLLLAGGIALTNLGAVMPAFAEDAPATPENAEAVTPETAEADTTAPNLVQITENLYNDLPDAPTGSYLGNMGLPVAIGETKIGISAWVSDLYDGVDAHMDADALNADENTVTIGKTPGTDYAIVPLLAQVEYPADGAVSEIILPDGVELLSYRSTDYEPIPADEQEQAEILHQTYSEQSAAATGLYVKASADFTAQLVYTDSDGSSQSKAIHVQISEDAAPTQMYADTGDDGIAAYAAGPTPPYATGKITSIAKEGGTSCSSEGSARWWILSTICSNIPTSAAPRTAAQPLTTTPPPTARGTICPVHPKIMNCWIWTIFCPPKRKR